MNWHGTIVKRRIIKSITQNLNQAINSRHISMHTTLLLSIYLSICIFVYISNNQLAWSLSMFQLRGVLAYSSCHIAIAVLPRNVLPPVSCTMILLAFLILRLPCNINQSNQYNCFVYCALHSHFNWLSAPLCNQQPTSLRTPQSFLATSANLISRISAGNRMWIINLFI